MRVPVKKWKWAGVAMLCLSLPLGSAQAGELVVSAASSLTNAFKAVGKAYEARQPGTTVIFNFGASDVILQQIVQGAPTDIFASADQVAMDKAVSKKAVLPETRRDFAANEVVMIVPAQSAIAVSSLDDLKSPQVKRITYGNPASVPVGRYARGALTAAGLWQTVEAKGIPAQNVRQALAYVARGEVDAGFVFATDAAIMKNDVRVAVRVPSDTPVTYPIARTTRKQAAKEAAGFIDFVLGGEGRKILADYGFQQP